MFKNGRKTIGVIINDVNCHYQEHVCQALTTYAMKAGYNLAYFSCYTCYGDLTTPNGKGEANIVHLVPFEKLDAVILCQDTLLYEEPLTYVLNAIKEKCKCPVVTLRQDTGIYPCVLVEDDHHIEQMVYHFIDEHKKTKFGFLSGPMEHPDSIKRLNQFKRALENRGIAFEDSMVFEGDFWHNKGRGAADYFTLETKECPEVIICANDYMAISLVNELVAKGVMVPNDIAVSGYDDIWEASIMIPPITSVKVPATQIAEQAMKKIERLWAGEEEERVTTVSSQLVIRNSCGCNSIDMFSTLAKRVRQSKEYENILDCSQNNIYFMIDLSSMDSIDGIEKHLHFEETFGNRVEHLFICLGEGEGDKYPKYYSNMPGYAKKSKAVGGLYHKQSIETESFDTSELLPEEARENGSMIYYFFPLHNNEYSFGYLAISLKGIGGLGKAFHYWLAILGNALETIRIKQKNQGLLGELNYLYVRDSLTGLYNRRGFDTNVEEYYKRAKKEGKSFAVVAIDMDNLKTVNDKFGHSNGDLALKTIGAAMKEVAKESDICSRIGGDEYNIIGFDYTKEELRTLERTFHKYLDDFNQTSGLPYLVNASVGLFLCEQGEELSLSQCLNAADKKMYEDKQRKKQEKRDRVLREDA